VNCELDIKSIKEKTIMLIPLHLEEKFKKSFDESIYLDLIENTEDFIAEGIASYFLNNIA
jgi:hypothetical protein